VSPDTSKTQRRTKGVMRALDDRLGSGKFLRNQLNKVFPDHWSFMLGEIALYSFVILLLTGTFLALFYHDTDSEIIYHGSYTPLRGVRMSDAYASVIHITFDVRAGLLIRQIHHWAALLFVAAIVVHAMRIFFTGAFRKPREINWILGVTLMILAIVEGFCGYSLPDDLLSGTGLRIAFSIVESIPVVGSYIAVFLWNGQYPGHGDFFPRLFILHVFVVPMMIAAILAAHLMVVWHQKHTQFAEPGRTERNVVGSSMWPTYTMKSLALLFSVFGVLVLMASYAQVNPVFLYGPSKVSAGSQPDWYMFWLEGALRLMPHVETHFLGHTIAWAVFAPAVLVPAFTFAAMYLYPFLERFVTRDHDPHELLQRPRNTPVRTGIGVATVCYLMVLNVSGANDVIPYTFQLNMMAFTWAMRGMFVLLPPVAFVVTVKVCHRLQRAAERKPPPAGAVVMLQPPGEYVVAAEPTVTKR
jgi:ubiquinol-cytochrome c reductase cytochrome b subunit